ncbi:uncharacterized protein LOC132703473 [Cylas formicarius]|uniref:uncharacterized protein LOC132703473 n=1 Tax=Cylas formicarius TaxID=197179 RepID=UPI0029587D8D|nr:uncharacterized protein LOC132703473 [Cylas formicarius]
MKMNPSMFLIWALLLCAQRALTHILGDECNSDWECREDIAGSICQRGHCSCQPFFARINQTTCLQSTLLGYDCVVPEQCSLKVANSSCLDGVCRCIDGFLQFRKHTCLGPARPGNVCYSNAHCQLWTADSHCDFLIPNLFGRCQCNNPFKQVADSCVRSAFQSKPTPSTTDSRVITSSTSAWLTSATTPSTTVPTSTKFAKNTGSPSTTTSSSTTVDPDIETNVINKPKIPLRKRPPFLRGGASSTLKLSPSSSTTEMVPTRKIHSTPAPVDVSTRINIANRVTTMEPPSTASQIIMFSATSTTTIAPTTGIRTRVENTFEAVSLGLPCVTDLQCRAADPSSRCMEGVCDCLVKTNETIACSARNRGCIPGTFQCRSTGTCISWFFVCDGRKDCSDGSDEDCKSYKCPSEAFRCKSSGKCISRANRCDGVRDCNGGEDEVDCQALGKRKCPPDTFQCSDGKCLPEYEFCNAIIGCSDGSDEPAHICRGRARRRISGYCPLRCGNGRCRSTAIACSGRDGCGDGTDESHCSVCRCPIAQGRSL